MVFRVSLLLMLAFATAAFESQTPIPIRELAAPKAISTRTFGRILNVRGLDSGKVLVNDGGRRQLIVLDSMLSSPQVLLDSVPGSTASYGPRASPLIDYLGDSTLFVDGQSRSLLLITPQGTTGRALSVPVPAIIGMLSGYPSSTDHQGNLVLVAENRHVDTLLASGRVASREPDSAMIVRANFESRTLDTIARVRVYNGSLVESRPEGDNAIVTTHTINPIVHTDEWAMLADGSLALVRGREYRVDFIRPDGSRQSSQKLPFDWKRLTDADKAALIDSVRTVQLQANAESDRRVNAATPPGARRIKVTRRTEFVPITQISDYQPAIRRGAVRADRDNNLWILPATSAYSRDGELVYDVVSGKGELTHRVRLPKGHALAGFGRNGTVYLMSREGEEWTLKRTNVVSTRGNDGQPPV